MEFPECPPSLKSIQHFLKLALEHDGRDIVVSYWSRYYAIQVALKLTSRKPEENALLFALMDWLEKAKKENSSNEAITNEVAAQAHLENYALKLFLYADKQDRESNFSKNVVKAFYCSGVVYDVLQTFGELTDECVHNRKYAKWKAAYIHNCLKNGETPVPGPIPDTDAAETDVPADAGANTAAETTDEDNAAENNADEDNVAAPAPTQPYVPPATYSLNPSPSIATPPTADEVLQNPSKLPSPPVDEEKPGGFEPYVGPVQPTAVYTPVAPVANLELTPEQMIKAQKYCKYAGSALNYDDVKSAVDNLQKALKLLTTGQED